MNCHKEQYRLTGHPISPEKPNPFKEVADFQIPILWCLSNCFLTKRSDTN